MLPRVAGSTVSGVLHLLTSLLFFGVNVAFVTLMVFCSRHASCAFQIGTPRSASCFAPQTPPVILTNSPLILSCNFTRKTRGMHSLLKTVYQSIYQVYKFEMGFLKNFRRMIKVLYSKYALSLVIHFRQLLDYL